MAVHTPRQRIRQPASETVAAPLRRGGASRTGSYTATERRGYNR